MEIYVVTSGSYSDYGIDKVFLDKEKAEHFAEWGFDRRVEIYNTDDDCVIEEVYKVHIDGRITQNGKVIIMGQYISKTNYLSNDNIWFYENDKLYLHPDLSGGYCFGFAKYIKNNNYDKQWLKNKYEKVYYDIANIIKNHLAQGANEYDINEMLKFYWEEDNNEK